METVKIRKYNEKEKQTHDNLLKSFSFVFSTKDAYCFGQLLHVDGVYFHGMNKTRVEMYFFHLFFNKKELSDYFNLHVTRAVSMDHLPGEEVLEFHFFPIKDERYKLLGLPNKEKVIAFAFNFKDDLIYSIRKPRKIEKNIREFEKLN